MTSPYSCRRHRNNRPIKGKMNLGKRIRYIYKKICGC